MGKEKQEKAQQGLMKFLERIQEQSLVYFLEFLSPSNQSNYYKVSTFGLAGSNNDYVRIVSSKPFGEDMFFTTVNPDGSGGVNHRFIVRAIKN